MKIDLSCPVLVKSLSFNKDEKAVVASFLNISPKTITAMKYTVLLFDAENNKLLEIPASVDEITLIPRENITASVSYEPCSLIEIAVSYTCLITHVVFACLISNRVQDRCT